MSPDDYASDIELQINASALEKQRASMPRTKIYTGYCQNERCEAPVEGDKRFCDADCRDEHDFILRQSQTRGRLQ